MEAGGKAVSEFLLQEIDIARELIILLQEEQNVLLPSAIDKLPSLIEKKALQLIELEKRTQARHQCLSEAGYAPTHAGMNEWLESQSAGTESAALARCWQELLSLTQAARELNEKNGALIASQMAHNKQAISILQGNQANTGLYGPDGQTSRSGVLPSARGLATG